MKPPAMAALLLWGLAALAGAGPACRAATTSTTARDGRLTVVGSFYPLVEAARRVGGTRVRVVNLTPAGVEPHDIELNSSQIDELAAARVVLYLGGGFQPAVERAVRRAHGAALDVLRAVPPDELRPGDPHVWLDPVLMIGIVEQVAQALSAADPPTADLYRRDAASYQAHLADLDAAYRGGLDHCARRALVTSHEAFGYLARRYHLDEIAVAGYSPAAEPDPRRLGELADLVRNRGVTTVFTEELVSPKVAAALAREAHVRTAVLSPIESLSRRETKRHQDYVSLMLSNLTVVRSALGCT